MALSDAVLAIADAMDTEAISCHVPGSGSGVPSLFRSFARELRTAVKASEGTQQSNLMGLALADTSGLGYHRQQIEAAKATLKNEREKTQVQEKDEQMVEIRGGGLDGTLHSVKASDLQVGMAHRIEQEVYAVKRDSDGVWLEFHEGETAKLPGNHKDDGALSSISDV